MVGFKYLLPIISKSKNLFGFILCIYLSPTYANDFNLRLICDVDTSYLAETKKWENSRMSWDLEVDIVNKTLIKKNFVFAKGEKYAINTNFKIISLKRNHLVAVTDELESEYTGAPRVATIILDNLLLESNDSVGVTYAWHKQSNGIDYFSAQYGLCN